MWNLIQFPPLRILHLGLVGGIIFLLFVLIPAVLLDIMEPVWSLFDSLYYCFISLTTVGLGDFIPGDDPEQKARSVYKTGVTIYLVLGLMAVMTLLNIVTNNPDIDITPWFKCENESVRGIIFLIHLTNNLYN